MARSKLSFRLATVLVIIGALFTWSFYRLLYELVGSALARFGVVGDFYQNLIIVVAMGLLLVLSGKRIQSYFK
jgi:uncharacterized membrane protein